MRRSYLWMLLALVVVGVIAGVAWWWYGRATPDMTELLRLNNRGVALMEQFQYEEAAKVFEEVVQRAPDWQPGRINLGIALLNVNQPETLERAAQLFRDLLKADPDNLYAHYSLGIILYNRGADSLPEAAEHFEAVTKHDPTDAHAWFFLGRAWQEEPDKAKHYYLKALELNPYLPGALNLVHPLVRQDDPKKADELLQRFKDLVEARWTAQADIKYGEMGKYAEVIGRPPALTGSPVGPLPALLAADDFAVKLAAQTRWATPDDFGPGPAGELRRLVRPRFGGTVVALDYDGDGKFDLFLTSAVVRDGNVQDLLLHNEGDGRYRDVTKETALADNVAGLGAVVADFDNDERPDLLVTRPDGVRLYRNAAGRFADVTREAGLDAMEGVALGAAFVDIDQDSDLDLIVARPGATAEAAVAHLRDPAAGQGGGTALWLNVGEAPPGKDRETQPLKAKFRRADDRLPASGGPAVNVLVSDLDDDRDVDLLLFGGKEPQPILNDRLLEFHKKDFAEGLLPTGTWTGGLVLDANRDERADLLLVGSAQPPRLLLQGKPHVGPWFAGGITNSPPLVQAQAVDLDLDGRTDVVGLSARGRPVLLHNDGQRLVEGKDAFAGAPDAMAVLVTDADGDGYPDALLWTAAGPRLLRSQGHVNRSLPVTLTGKRDLERPARTNSDAIGAWVSAQTPHGWTTAEVTTLQAGLGQSRQPLWLGLGRAAQADFVRVRWPDGVLQAELQVPAGQPALIREHNRKTISCPLLFTWNGRTFEYVTDLLGAGSLGERLPGGGHRTPRGEESVKIEARQLVPKSGQYVLKFAEPMDEVTYLDGVQLLVVDHPAGVQVYPDERFTSDPRGPSQDLLAFRTDRQIFPARATDQRGRDVTATLRHRDRATVDGFARRAWIGIADEHWVELDFGDRLQGFGPDDRLVMFLAGWTDYPFPESMWAATQAGVAVRPPSLERWHDGRWLPVPIEFGFPAGLPRVMTVDLTGRLTGPTCRLRLKTNMHVFWDQLFVAPLSERVPAGRTTHASPLLRVAGLDVQRADLAVRGCVQEFSPDGREPTCYDHDRLAPIPVVRLAGRLTKLGDVTDLLQGRDDHFVIFGPGDEVTATFDALALPPLPAGWQRSFVLRTWGYCKDSGPFTATGGTVEPLPFHGMSTFPYPPGEHGPGSPAHAEYLRRYQTRRVGP